MAYRDRKLVKHPKPIRFDEYLDEYIAASANFSGVSYSEMVRIMCQAYVKEHIEMMTASNKADDRKAERI